MKKNKGTSWAEKRVVGFTAENWEAWCWSCWHYCKCSRSSNSEDSCRSSTSMAQTGSYAGQLQIYNCSDPKAENSTYFFIFFNPSLTPSFSFPKILAWISSFPYLMVLTSFFRRNFLTTFDFLWDSRTCWRSFMSLLPWWGVMRLTWSPRY